MDCVCSPNSEVKIYIYILLSGKNLIVIKPEKCTIKVQKSFLKLGLLNITSLTPKAVIVNEIITDNRFDVLCLTETWLKPNYYIGLNESTPPSYCYKHEPRQTGCGGGVQRIPVDSTNDALGLAFTDLINSFGVKKNVPGPPHRFNHTLDLIISHRIDLSDIDIIPQSEDVSNHFLVSCMLHITDIKYMAPRYRPGRPIVPVTKDRFTNNLPDLSQLLCVPINKNELDKNTRNIGTIFSNTLETDASIKLKKVREKRAAPWYNSYTNSLKKETRNLERK